MADPTTVSLFYDTADYRGPRYRDEAPLPEQEVRPMADPAHIEAIQAAKAAEAHRVLQEQVVHHLLAVLDPQPGDAQLDYRGLLQRAQTVMQAELAKLGE